MSNTIVPLMSSGTAGPLGALHLPRLWSKLTLDAAGKLPDGYDACGNGFDAMTLKALGLDRTETMDYVKTKKPTYVQFEEYVVQKNGGTVPKSAIEAHNAAIRGYKHADDLGEKMRKSSGIHDANIKDAVTLNMIEDLDEMHAHVSK
ncbi:MAG: hypothetical protein NVSMB5_11090 [Candidatus Velthaea sp.]